MTQTTTHTEPVTLPDTSGDIPTQPFEILLNLIAVFLAPMFLGVTGGNIAFARMAAIETVNAYRAQSQADLVAIAQIVACGLAALGSLSLSMADDVSLPMTLRLRGNAVALNRAAEQNRRALDKNRGGKPVLHPGGMADIETPVATEPEEPLSEAAVVAGVAAARTLVAETAARLRAAEPAIDPSPAIPAAPQSASLAASSTAKGRETQMIWAAAMIKEAERVSAGLSKLPSDERRAASIRIAALTTTASDLLHGASKLPPGPRPSAT